MLVDPSGTIPFSDGFFDEAYRQIGEWLEWLIHDTVDSICAYISNDSPGVVKDSLEVNGFSFYKGVPVFSADWIETSAFSFGIIIIGISIHPLRGERDSKSAQILYCALSAINKETANFNPFLCNSKKIKDCKPVHARHSPALAATFRQCSHAV